MLTRHLIVVAKAEESPIAVVIKMGEILATVQLMEVWVLLKSTMEEIHAINGATEQGVMEAWATTFKREELKSMTMA